MTDNALARTATTELAPTPAADAGATALAEQVRAGMEARTLVALRRPRNMDQVRDDLLKDCKRPSFVNSAIYSMPIGGNQVEGPSIRFAEACVQHMGNLDVDILPIYDGEDRVKLIVAAVDLERNTRITAQVDVPKVVVSKKKPRDDKAILGTRYNSWGDLTYLVRADEQRLRPKINAEISKAMRTTVLRLIPGWLIDEALAQIRETMRNQAAEDPDAYRRQVADAFSSIGVKPAALGDYLGHDLGEASPDELLELKAVYLAVRDGHASWRDVMAAKTGIEEGDEEAQAAASELMTAIAATKDRLGGKKPPSPAPQGGGDSAPAKGAGGKAQAKGGASKGRKRAKDKAEPAPPPSSEEANPEAGTEPAPPEVVEGEVPPHHKGLTPEEIAQGWEVDPATGEAIPPMGAGG